MARRREHSLDEIREMMLQAAETIVTEEGLSGLKVRKLAMEIGYTVGSIYMVFKNIDDLIMHLKVRVLEDLQRKLEQAVNTEQDGAQAIVTLARTYLHFANQQFNRWRLVFDHHLPEDEETPEGYQQRVDSIFTMVERYFRRLHPECPEKETETAARAVWGGIHGVCILSLTTGGMETVGINNVEDSVVLLTENFIRGWRSADR